MGLAFLPASLIMGALSVGVSARLVMRFGIRPPLAAGLAVAAIGLVLLARAPLGGSFAVDVLPSMLLLGFGAGIAFNPVLLAAMSDVAPQESGLASGVVNYRRPPQRDGGQTRARARPMRSVFGTKPNARESVESARLSPSTKTERGATLAGPKYTLSIASGSV